MTIDPPAEGSVSREHGLAAFARIYEVTSHPLVGTELWRDSAPRHEH